MYPNYLTVLLIGLIRSAIILSFSSLVSTFFFGGYYSSSW